jgi:predicted ATPase
MIQEFSIENTYSIKERQTISFEATGSIDEEHTINIAGTRLLKLAAVYGANASGKSNILKAFAFYINFILNSCTSLKPHEPTGYTPFLGSAKALNWIGSFELVFIFNDTKYCYTISLSTSAVTQERLDCYQNDQKIMLYSLDSDLHRGDDSDFKIVYGNDFADKENNKIAHLVRPNATFLSTAAQFNHPLLSKMHDFLNRIMLQINGSSNNANIASAVYQIQNNPDGRKKILSLLSGADFGNICNIGVVEALGVSNVKENIFFSHNFGEIFHLPYAYESRGTQRFFELTSPLIESFKTTRILCIDEIESSLHDDLLMFFIKTFLENSKQSQLLFTTHNQNLLDSDLLQDDEIWFVQKTKKGPSEIFSLVDFKDVPENVSRRELYKAGAFGALPFIKDYALCETQASV